MFVKNIALASQPMDDNMMSIVAWCSDQCERILFGYKFSTQSEEQGNRLDSALHHFNNCVVFYNRSISLEVITKEAKAIWDVWLIPCYEY